MASLQCYRSAKETCETKCHDNDSFGHKESEMAGMVFKGNHHGHHASSQGHSYGQTPGYHHHPDHTISKTQTQCYSQTQTYPDHAVSKTHCTQCVSQSHGHGYHAMAHSQSYNHGHNMRQHQSHGMACRGKTHEKKMKSKCEYKKKEMSRCNKRRDGNMSCSDSDSN